jgi:hypothetical protein
MSKRLIVVGIAGAIAILGVFGTAMAQKMHAPKAEWKAMVAGLSDIQDITASLMVFNMDRIATTADELAQRETFISEIASLPDDVKEGHAKVAEAAEELAGAALTGEEREVTAGIADVIAACNACHYDVRDEKRRQKMQ